MSRAFSALGFVLTTTVLGLSTGACRRESPPPALVVEPDGAKAHIEDKGRSTDAHATIVDGRYTLTVTYLQDAYLDVDLGGTTRRVTSDEIRAGDAAIGRDIMALVADMPLERSYDERFAPPWTITFTWPDGAKASVPAPAVALRDTVDVAMRRGGLKGVADGDPGAGATFYLLRTGGATGQVIGPATRLRDVDQVVEVTRLPVRDSGRTCQYEGETPYGAVMTLVLEVEPAQIVVRDAHSGAVVHEHVLVNDACPPSVSELARGRVLRPSDESEVVAWIESLR